MSAIKLLFSLIHPLGIVKGFTLWGGGGGGGGGGAQTGTQTNVAELPDWAKGYAQDVLAKGQALTDTNQNYYQPYQGQRVAGLTNLQQQAMNTAASPQAFTQQVKGYMQPYMEGVVGTQMRQAREQAGAQMGALNAQAAQRGAFGGSGLALQREAANRDLSKQLEGIQATGYQQAVQQGIQQANLANQQQMQYGTMQQQLEQQGLSNSYQDFLNQKNYPYQQLSYMSNLIRGTPMGMNNTSQVYQGAPTGLQTIGAIGAGAYGLSKLAGAAGGGLMESYAEGGAIQGYAGDNGSVVTAGMNDEKEMATDVHMLDDAALEQRIQHPTTKAEYDAAVSEKAFRASMRSGLASGVSPEMVQRMAGGGILAFNERGSVNSSAKSTDEELAKSSWSDSDIDALLARNEEGGGTVTPNPQIGQIANSLLSYTPRQFSPSQLAALDEYNFQRLSKAAGPNEAAQAYQKSLAARGEATTRDFEMAKGLAALQAMPAFLQPGGTSRGLAGGVAKWGAGFGDAMATKRASEEHLAKAQFDLTDAQRKERQGLHSDAKALTASYVKNQGEGEKLAQLAKAKAGELLVNQQKAQALASRGGGGDKTKLPEQTLALKLALSRMDPADPRYAQLEKDVKAAEAVLAMNRTSEKGPNTLSSADTEKAAKEWGANYITTTAQKKWAVANGIDVTNPAWPAAARAEFIRNWKPGAEAAPAPAPAPVTPAPAAKPQTDIAAAAKAGFGGYEPDKYDYRIDPKTGNLQRKAK